MHPCLLIPEIQLCVFYRLFDTDDGPLAWRAPMDARKTLAALARTCRAFQEAALDVQWGDLDCLARLIQCLPRDLWGMAPHKDTTLIQVIVFHRPMVLSDWAIFHKYAPRVRSLSGAYGSTLTVPPMCIRISPEVFGELSSSPIKTTLLPNLTTLKWYLEPANFPVLEQLLSTRLGSLIITTNSHMMAPRELSMLSSLGDICPQLKCLAFTGRIPSNGPIMEVLSRSVCRLRRLEKLVCGMLTPSAMVCLARAPSLTHLTFMLPDSILPESHPRAPAFPGISSLDISASSLVTVASFMEQTQASTDTLNVHCLTASPAAVIGQFFASLSPMNLGKTLTRIVINDLNEEVVLLDHVDPPGYIITIEAFRPLLRYRDLLHLELEFQSDFILNDIDLKEIAGAFPCLEILLLNRTCGWRTPTRATSQGLLSVLGQCPSLRQLAVIIDFSSIESNQASLKYSRGGIIFSRLDELHLGNSKLENPDAVAAFLSSILRADVWIATLWDDEAMEYPDAGEAEAEEYDRRWRAVRTLLDGTLAGDRENEEGGGDNLE
ncbi:hypothetical protein BV22DRAFT_1053386 [Leucogyrophana mollusca]|uniref:Uncharacterized protein n=1 Tax=Leucogyrophana mollusca TaxID=85980 RepID=A0ACB8C0N0_9AGAM|nr:hypothetical protein BV22DRAFT_1053386 [Leucogyrophana mollusca]